MSTQENLEAARLKLVNSCKGGMPRKAFTTREAEALLLYIGKLQRHISNGKALAAVLAPKPAVSKRAIRLQLFATRVLTIMERHADWNSDTMEEIASAAFGGKVAYVNKDSQFRASRPRKVRK